MLKCQVSEASMKTLLIGRDSSTGFDFCDNCMCENDLAQSQAWYAGDRREATRAILPDSLSRGKPGL